MAWDLEGRPLVIFYCFAGIAAFLFMLSTIYAVLQIMMIYEMRYILYNGRRITPGFLPLPPARTPSPLSIPSTFFLE